MNKNNAIVPIFDQMVSQLEREKLYGQKAQCIWFTGRPGSGKSTLAIAFEKMLLKKGFKTILLDGDNVRNGLNSDLKFSDADRYENIRRIAEINKLLIQEGFVVINSFVSPTENIRNMANEIIGDDHFKLIYVNASLEVCQHRDPKKHYKKASEGEIQSFTGVQSTFEEPQKSFLTINTNELSVEVALVMLEEKLLSHIELPR